MGGWQPDLPSAGALAAFAFIIFCPQAHAPELQKKRDLRKKQRGKGRDKWQM